MITLPKEMIDTYIQRRVADLETLQKGLKDNSVTEFNRIGHQLAGNARNFGFETLELIAQKMEKLTPAELPVHGPGLIKEFNTWLNTQIKK